MTAGVAALLEPRSIAVLGATPRADSLGGRPIINLDTQGFRGTIYPINPRYEAIGDRPCYPDLASLPAPPDVVLVLVGTDRVFEALDQATEAGAKAAIVFGGGFAEAGVEGAVRQQRLAEYRSRGLRICGPNVNGLFNVAAGIAMGFSPNFERPARRGAVALLSQSGAIATSLSSRGMETGIGFSHVIATGNEADLEIADFLELLIADPVVRVMACFVETLRDPPRFLACARRALEAGKPIVVTKAGRSAAGQAMSMSHTGAMTGAYDVFAGAMRQAGVVVADTLDALLGTASVLATVHRPRAHAGLGVMSLSGGMASIVADGCEAQGVPLAAFSADTNAALRAALSDIATVSNPLDVTGQVVPDVPLWGRCAGAMTADPGVDSLLSVVSIMAGGVDRRIAGDIVAAANGMLPVCVWTSAAPDSAGISVLRDAGMPMFDTVEGALAALADWRHYWITRERRLAVQPASKARSVMPNLDAWTVLETAGIPIARQRLAVDRAALPAALAALRFPLAMKIQSDDIPHKTDFGLVQLGVGDAEAASATFDQLMSRASEACPSAAVEGVLLQEMVAGRREMILGLRHDPSFGAAIVFGLGGVFSEVFRDVSVRLAPVSPLDAREMIDGLRGRALLDQVRDLAAADLGVIADVICRFAEVAVRVAGNEREFEINPLIVSDDGRRCTAIDVLLGRQVAPAG